jgi:diphosphomevalonate decarboxylase
MSAGQVTTRHQAVRSVLQKRSFHLQGAGEAFAPANIALCKYWGKRDAELNLPRTSSLSLSLGTLGTRTRLAAAEADEIVLNGEPVHGDDPFAVRLLAYLDSFREAGRPCLWIDTVNTIPTAAGLASSASGFAALVAAMNHACRWDLGNRALSILARLGSGSAARSVLSGFVKWHAGTRDDGMDSFAESLPAAWPELRMAAALVSKEVKPIGSREAMNRTVDTSILYDAWPKQVDKDLNSLQRAIEDRDFQRLGGSAEANALAMHATMMAARPAVMYWHPESVGLMHRVWALRDEGLPVYFTMDAGPNLKLLFEFAHEATIKEAIDLDWVVVPFP